MFGGGTQLDVQLTTNKIPEGGTLAGTVRVGGGKKPLTITAVKVGLVSVKVESQEDSPMPKVELQTLLDNTIASNQELPPGSNQSFDFSFQVPTGVDPSSSFKVVASADIPKVKDPRAEAELTIVSPGSADADAGLFNKLKGTPTEDQILARFPGLMSTDEEVKRKAFHHLNLAAYDRDNDFINIADFVGQALGRGSARLRRNALQAWGNILNNRAQPGHIEALTQMASDPAVVEDRKLLQEVISVAAKFAEEGAEGLVQWFAQHPDPFVRSRMAMALSIDADETFQPRRSMLLTLANDPDPGVRAAAIGGLRHWRDDPALVQDLAHRATSDPSPDVQAACLSAISLAHHHGMAEIVFSVAQQLLGSPHVKVRKEVAHVAQYLPTDPRVVAMVQALLADPSADVRASMARLAGSLDDQPELRPLFVAACNDPDDEVKSAALSNIGHMVGFAEAIPLYRQRIAQEPTEAIYNAVYWGIANELDETGVLGLMQELCAAPFADVAQRARTKLAEARA